jgi:hypothetical protein
MQDESLRGTRATATEARRGPLRARLATCLAACLAGLFVPACVDSQKLREAFDPCARDGCQAPPPQDCGALPSLDWAVDGYLTAPEAQLAVGASYRASLAPAVEAHCSGAVAGVTWTVEDPGIVALTPIGRDAWVSGLAVGATSLGARIRFTSGAERIARPRAVRVAPPAAPAAGSVVVAEGSVRISPDRGVPGGWHGWVTFATTAAGRVDVVVDWTSPLNTIDMSGYEGRCDAVGRCGRIVMTTRVTGVKPLSATFDSPRLPPGEYTVRIDNLGPGEETVRYEVRLTAP